MAGTLSVRRLSPKDTKNTMSRKEMPALPVDHLSLQMSHLDKIQLLSPETWRMVDLQTPTALTQRTRTAKTT
jgi:hypothetical protein